MREVFYGDDDNDDDSNDANVISDGSQQYVQIMNTLNAMLHTQEALATKLIAIEQTLQHIQGVYGITTTQLQTTPYYFTYEMFTDYLTTRLAFQLEERTRLAPILLEFRYCYHLYVSIVINYIINVKLIYYVDLFVR